MNARYSVKSCWEYTKRNHAHILFSKKFHLEKKFFLIEDNYIRVECDKCHRRVNIKCNEDSETGKIRFSKDKKLINSSNSLFFRLP